MQNFTVEWVAIEQRIRAHLHRYRCDFSKMDLLLKTALLRFLGFLLFVSVSSWLFVLVEYSEEDNVLTKYNLLNSLYESMASKYNMTLEEFNTFSNQAHEALSEPKLQWTYFASLEFVLQAITTIGKKNIRTSRNIVLRDC